jgi:molecular chaperone DnaK
MAKLNEAWTAASQDIYNAMNSQQGGAQQPQGDGQPGAGSQNGETVTDAEFEEVK